ncbi:putative methanogenesis marker protein 1 [Hartmannibacter diazotrophicus]|uniref:Putative methanogenesis marker protein 1 n=2 Tax=Hartmannibacter diazotrophicus TaxID=1482074 RepID=A0A2C9D759_9HYPH|nr:putative methanogenesis marker protein 1 [Hartmannibacter diazotrophicus]
MIARLRAAMPALGITRVGRLTGLDRIGIPVWMAVRPNAANLSVSQGKGTSDNAAYLSAVMESVELFFAERENVHGFRAARGALEAAGQLPFDASRFLRQGANLPEADRQIRWVEGYDLIRQRSVAVPEEAVAFRDAPAAFFWQGTHGLGAGGCLTEAIVQGICELIERDSTGLWSLRSQSERMLREVDPAQFADADVVDAIHRVRRAGPGLRLFDLTTNVGVPTYQAVLVPQARAGAMRFLDVASGTGTHPLASRALLRAITEAAQTRLTTIAGARDDLAPDDYERPLPDDLQFLLFPPDVRSGCDFGLRASLDGSFEWNAPALLDHLLAGLTHARIRSAVVVPFASEAIGVAVAKMLIPDLEQDAGSGNRKLGRRAIAAMLGKR